MNKYLLYILLVVFFSCNEKATNPESEEDLERFDLVLRNANVIDLETGTISQSNVFINGKRIEKIVPVDQKLAYFAHQSYNVEGKYVLPGYWDNHVHFRGGDSLIEANRSFLNLFIANGITTVRDAGGDLTPAVMQWKKQIEKGELIGPTIFTSGPKIDGPKARWEGSIEVESLEDIKLALDSLQAIGVDFVKLYDSTISADAYLNTIKEAENRGIITSGHMPFSVTLNQSIEAGLDGVEHLYYIFKACSSEEATITESVKNGELSFWGSMSKLIETYDDSTAQKTFKRLRDNNVFVVPTNHIGNVLSYLDEVDHSKDEYLQYMTDGIIRTYEGRIQSALRASEDARNNRKNLNTIFKKLIKDLNDADVTILAGSDCGAFNSYVYPGISFHEEMEALVESGLSPLEALRASAYNGARFLKQESDLGSIEEGKIADIVVLNGNPLIEISKSNDIHKIIKNGRVVDSTTFVQ